MLFSGERYSLSQKIKVIQQFVSIIYWRNLSPKPNRSRPTRANYKTQKVMSCYFSAFIASSAPEPWLYDEPFKSPFPGLFVEHPLPMPTPTRVRLFPATHRTSQLLSTSTTTTTMMTIMAMTMRTRMQNLISIAWRSWKVSIRLFQSEPGDHDHDDPSPQLGWETATPISHWDRPM